MRRLFVDAVTAGGIAAVALAVGSITWQRWVAVHAYMTPCPDCRGSGEAVGGYPGEDCPTCHGTGEDPDEWMPKGPARSRVQPECDAL